MSSYARSIVLEAACGLLITRAGLRVTGFRRWKAAVEWMTPWTAAQNAPVGQPEIEFARAIARWQAAAARHLPVKTNCLDRSLTLCWLLRRRGIAAELRMGGRKENGRFEAHAWVEVGAVALDVAGGSRGVFEPFGRRAVSMEAQIP
jgi:Transglutaminase-like superfamily